MICIGPDPKNEPRTPKIEASDLKNKDKIITDVVDNAKAAVTEEITKALPGIINSVVEIPEIPEVPKITGPAIPF